MNRYEALKKKLRDRKPVSMTYLCLLQSPLLIDAMQEADCVLLDKEHGLYGTEDLIPLTMRCRQIGLPAIVRVEDNLYHLIAKAMDLGADGIMLPRVETVEQVRTAVDAMYPAPVGRTGFGGWGLLRGEETVRDLINNRILLPQIESVRGLEAIPAILEACGDYVDGFIIGPNDYSITMGLPRELDHPAVVEQIGKVFEVCRKHGKSCGCYAADAEHARLYQDMGANVFWIGDDASYIRLGLHSQLAGIPGLLETK